MKARSLIYKPPHLFSFDSDGIIQHTHFIIKQKLLANYIIIRAMMIQINNIVYYAFKVYYIQ